jgi:hypothetical protein
MLDLEDIERRKSQMKSFVYRSERRQGHGPVRVVLASSNGRSALELAVGRIATHAQLSAIDGTRQRGGFSRYIGHAR